MIIRKAEVSPEDAARLVGVLIAKLAKVQERLPSEVAEEVAAEAPGGSLRLALLDIAAAFKEAGI